MDGNLLLWVFGCFWCLTGLDRAQILIYAHRKLCLGDYLKEYSNIYYKSLEISDQQPEERFWFVHSAIVGKGKTMTKDYLEIYIIASVKLPVALRYARNRVNKLGQIKKICVFPVAWEKKFGSVGRGFFFFVFVLSVN